MNCLFWEHKCKSEVFQKGSIVQNRPEFNSCCGNFTCFASSVFVPAKAQNSLPALTAVYSRRVFRALASDAKAEV